MSGKQFLLLAIVLAVIGGAGLALYNREQDSWQAAEPRVGQNLVMNFPVNEVAEINVKQAKKELTLAFKDGQWRVTQRANYPANFEQLSELLLKVQDLKIVQSEPIAPEQLAGLQLLEPGKGEASGARVEFKDKAGKTIASLLLGKPHMKETGGAGAGVPAVPRGIPAGRFVLVGEDQRNVAIINDPLSQFEPAPKNWLAKDFVRVENLKSLTVTSPDGLLRWKISRDNPAAPWRLAEAKSGEQFDASNGDVIANALSSLTFSDVAVGLNAKETELDKAVVATAETFDSLAYSIQIGKTAGEDRFAKIALSGEPVKQRVAAANEKPDEKPKLDLAFEQQLKALEARVKREKTLDQWTYLVPEWKFAPLLKERAQLMVQKKDAGQSEQTQPEGPELNPLGGPQR